MNDDIRRHNVIYKSLREYLVPMSKWFDDMYHMECTGPFSLGISPQGRDVFTGSCYTVPYPFKNPLWVDILQHRKTQTGETFKPGDPIMLRDEDYQLWTENITQRVNPFIEHCIHDEVIAELDNHYDTGVIVHITSGTIFPFEYSKIKSFSIVVIPVSVTLLLAKLSPNHMGLDDDQYMRTLNVMTQHIMDYDMFYIPDFKTESGDIYTNPGDYGRISYRTPIPRKDVDEITKYFNTMITAHAKCIPIP